MPSCWEIFRQFRAPEEYKVELLSEMVNIFSLGNVICCIVVGVCTFEDTTQNEYRWLIKDGILPPVKREYRESDNSIDRALLKAMDMCLIYWWQDRAKAYEIRNVLFQELQNVKEIARDKVRYKWEVYSSVSSILWFMNYILIWSFLFDKCYVIVRNNVL